jgi:hypothetical protein
MLRMMTTQIMAMTLMIHTMIMHHTDHMNLAGSSLFH